MLAARRVKASVGIKEMIMESFDSEEFVGIDIKKIKKLVDYDLVGKCKNEEDVKINFIVQLLEAFGHERFDFEHKNMDIFIKYPAPGCSMIIEAKHHNKKLSKYVSQLKRYWDETNSEIAILCNGQELWIYSPFWGKSSNNEDADLDLFKNKVVHYIKKKELLSIRNLRIIKDLLSLDAIRSGSVRSNLKSIQKKIESGEIEIDKPKDHLHAQDTKNTNNTNLYELPDEIESELEMMIKKWVSAGNTVIIPEYNPNDAKQVNVLGEYVKKNALNQNLKSDTGASKKLSISFQGLKTKKIQFRVDICSPKIAFSNIQNRGSRLVAGGTNEDIQKVRDLGFTPRNTNGTGDWIQHLDPDTPHVVYDEFVSHAIEFERKWQNY